MLLNPAIFIQISVSVTCMVLFIIAAGFALKILYGWDIESGSELQLKLERATYLISTIVSFGFISSAAGFIYFIMTCESISPQFVGAMCATGVLNANPYGWMVLILKIIIFFGSTTWLLINYIDNQGYDYPLIKIKYGLLLSLLPLAIFETLYLYFFFSALNPDLIVSCCGSMFSVSANGVAAHVSSIAPKTALPLFIGSGLGMLISWLLTLKYEQAGYLYGVMALGTFVTALVCIVSLISPYIYEHPNHHCPFCMLKAGYHFAGVFLYLPLFFGTGAAMGAISIKPCDRFKSIKTVVTGMVKSLIHFSFGMLIIFYTLAGVFMVKSNLIMAFWYK